MTSGKDDHDGDVDMPLSAIPIGNADDSYDDSEDNDFSDSSDVFLQTPRKKKSGGMMKVVAPLLVLAVAGGVGGYIVMNPDIIRGAQPLSVPASPAPLPSDIAMASPSQTGDVQVVPDTSEIPQPAVNVNEAVSAETEMPAELPVLEVAPDSVESAIVPSEANSVEVVAGSDLIPVSESVNVNQTPVDSGDITPEIQPEISAESPAPDSGEMPPEGGAGVLVESPVNPPADALRDALPEQAVSPVQEMPDNVVAPAMPAAMQAPDMPAADPEIAATVSGVADAPSAQVTAPADNASDVYYDSLSQIPSGEVAKAVGIREINPVLEPASKMIIVGKGDDADSPEALLVAANRALKLKRYDSALEMFDQLYAKNKRDVRILMGRAVAQQSMGLAESAIQSYEEVLSLKPDNTEALVNMLGLIRTQYPEVALRRLLDLYAKNPNNAGIAAQIGITNAGLGYYEDAIRYLGIAATLEPSNAQHAFNMAIAADKAGHAAEAIRLYEKALETDVMYGASRSIPREKIYDRLSVLRRG